MAKKFVFNESMDFIDPALRGGAPEDLSDCEVIYPWFQAMLRYEPKTGLLLWNQMTPDPYNRSEIVATRRLKTGRGRVRFEEFTVVSCNLVWFLHHRRWPNGLLERADGDLRNDRIENLREKAVKVRDDADCAERRGRPRFRPVGVARLHDRWQAYAPLPLGRRKNLGVFKTQEAAVAARKAWDDGNDLF